MTEKNCKKCGETKAVTEFHRNKSSSDGLQAYCKACHAPMLAASKLRKKQNPSSVA